MKPSKSVLKPSSENPIFKRKGDLEAEHFQNYSEYSKTLRAWLVAYGIGGPVLIFTNDNLIKILSASPDKAKIIFLFLTGVGCQVLLAFINKWCAWHMYAGENELVYRQKMRYRIWELINGLSLLDFILDAISLIAFSWSTWLIINILI